MFQAASEVGVSPIGLGFTGALRVIRRAIPQFQQAAFGEKPLFLSWLVAEMLDQIIPKRQSRVNPQVVKKARSKFPSAKPFYRGIGTQVQRLNLTVVLTGLRNICHGLTQSVFSLRINRFLALTRA